MVVYYTFQSLQRNGVQAARNGRLLHEEDKLSSELQGTSQRVSCGKLLVAGLQALHLGTYQAGTEE
jgi:hypothetical protein